MPTTTKKKKKRTRPSSPPQVLPEFKHRERVVVPRVDYSKPTPVNDVELAFPAVVIGRYLPREDEIPSDIKSSPWFALANRWFYHGIDGSFVVKEGVDGAVAARHLKACLGSYQPGHEHKMAGVAYLMSLWFERYEEPTPTEASA